jgi:hypothetical protein
MQFKELTSSASRFATLPSKGFCAMALCSQSPLLTDGTYRSVAQTTPLFRIQTNPQNPAQTLGVSSRLPLCSQSLPILLPPPNQLGCLIICFAPSASHCRCSYTAVSHFEFLFLLRVNRIGACKWIMTLNVMPCNLVHPYQCFRITYCLPLRGKNNKPNKFYRFTGLLWEQQLKGISVLCHKDVWKKLNRSTYRWSPVLFEDEWYASRPGRYF